MAGIIHVDNSGFFRKQMQIYLAHIGFECEGYGSGKDALIALEGGGISYVITGLELADMKSEDFIQQIFLIANHVQVIVVTSSRNEERFNRLKELGVEYIVEKVGDWKGELNHILE